MALGSLTFARGTPMLGEFAAPVGVSESEHVCLQLWSILESMIPFMESLRAGGRSLGPPPYNTPAG